MELPPTSRLLLAAALAYVSVPLALPLLPTQPKWLPWLLGLTAGGWLGWFFSLVPLPAPRPLARVGAALGALLASIAVPLTGYVVTFVLMFAIGTSPFLARDNLPLNPSTFESTVDTAKLILPLLLTGLGFGGLSWIIHRALDPRLRGRKVGWTWLAPGVWAVIVPPLTLLVAMPELDEFGSSATGPVALTVLATLPHLIAQIALARRLAATPLVTTTPNA